jgi:hypothetical protein
MRREEKNWESVFARGIGEKKKERKGKVVTGRGNKERERILTLGSVRFSVIGFVRLFP